MAPIYLAAHNTGTAIPAFSQKGVVDLMPGVVGDVPAYIEPTETSYPR